MGCPGVVYVDNGDNELEGDEAALDNALDVMPAIDIDTLKEIELTGSLEAPTELKLVWDVDWFMYDGVEELPVQEPYVV